MNKLYFSFFVLEVLNFMQRDKVDEKKIILTKWMKQEENCQSTQLTSRLLRNWLEYSFAR